MKRSQHTKSTKHRPQLAMETIRRLTALDLGNVHGADSGPTTVRETSMWLSCTKVYSECTPC